MQWNVYRPDDNSFSVKLPGKYETSTDTISTDIGDIAVTLVHHRCRIDNYCFHDDPHSDYALVHMDYPLGTFPKDSTELIDLFIEESIENRRLELGKETIIDYKADLDREDYNGMMVRFSNPSTKALCKGKFIVYDDRLIVLQVVSSSKQIQRQEVGQFLDSFDPNLE